MITKNFDISEKPSMVYDAAAYVVDYKNVTLHRQYIEKYYDINELDWFDKLIVKRIHDDKNDTMVIYYRQDTITYDYKLETSRATEDNFTIYYLTKVLMSVE